ncbi:unnamed protein product [Paramecium pentaurelia]|uniref:NF-X1-type domain-containing protein n=1 Tax=Paramecium pentaurelia TaxID=43138 RepID=A0A8S1TNI7_9CILI|nr:unnamed protein product [Paramecium pentaurelia]
MYNDDQPSILQLENNVQDQELSLWIRDCFIQQFDIEKILYRLDNDKNIKKQLKYLNPTHQLFDYYYYLIQTMSEFVNINQNIKKYLEYIAQSQSFQNQISERCHLIITQAESIDNLEYQIEQLFQIFFLLKDIDMNILKQSNISQIFTLQKIIEINFPECNYNALYKNFDQFLCLLQDSAEMQKYNNIPSYPQPLEFIQFGGENKQMFGKTKNHIESTQNYLNYLFNFQREDYIYNIREDIHYLSEKGFYKPIDVDTIDLYQDIRLISFEINNFDILWKISLEQFNLDGRKIKLIDWNYSKKLHLGSLICITNVECHPLLFGIITHRSQKQDDYNIKQRINLQFRFLGSKSQIMEFLNLLSQQTIFMECKTSTQAESLIYQLESIKKIQSLNYIDSFIQKNLFFKNSSQNFDTFLQQQQWSQLMSTLDEQQQKAIQYIVYENLALIQGLPGTGKTHCAILAVRILIKNMLEKDKPIMIVCQNNHTLDYFLEKIIEYIPINQVARLGGSSESAIVQKCLFKTKSKIDFDQVEFQELKKCLHIIFNRLIQYDYTIDAQYITRFWPQLKDKLINDFLLKIDLNNSQIDDVAQNQILNSWINVKQLIDSILQFETQLFQVHQNFQKEQIIEQIELNNIFGQQTKQSFNQQDQDQQTLNFSLQNESPTSPFEQFNSQNQNESNLHYNFKGIEKIQECLQDKTLNFWELNYNDICEIIKYLKYLKYQEDCLLFEKIYRKFKKMSQTLNDLNDSFHIKKLNEYEIIGVTFSDAAYYNNILTQLNSKVLIIEEADEVLKSDITTILTNNVKRLILIGNEVNLANSFNSYHQKNIDLFRRLNPNTIFRENKIPQVILSTQRRMEARINDFVSMFDTKNYLDDQILIQISNKKEIIGLNSNIFIFNHYQLEQIDSKSKENAEEAEMIFQMVQYLIQVGYKESQITILSIFQKQVQGLKKKFMNQNQQQVKVETVNNYLGEENDIVIISLVINDNHHLYQKKKNQQKIKIAFSRAKLGLYVFGNFDFLQINSDKPQILYELIKDFKRLTFLEKLITLAEIKNFYSDTITLKCRTHGKQSYVQKSSDWFKFKAGCCDQVCNQNFDKCNHTCQEICHLGNHPENNCQEQCQRILQCGHKCQQLCRVQCTCTQMIYVTLPVCNHRALINCGQDPAEVLCLQDQELQFLNCKHLIHYQCYQREDFLYKCQHACDNLLQCGHLCSKKCWEICQPCEQKCVKRRNCGHLDECQNLCYQSCSPCNQKITIQLDCGKHSIQNKCFQIQNHILKEIQAPPFFLKSKIGSHYLIQIMQMLKNGQKEPNFIFKQVEDYKCKNPCTKPRKCGHIFECKNFCSQECTQCEQVITLSLECGHKYQLLCKDQNNLLQNQLSKNEQKILSQCQHQKNQLSFETYQSCSQIIRNQIGYKIKCQQVCNRQRQCGHIDPCINKCGQKCSPCQYIITKTLDCRHELQIECSSENLQCNRPCTKIRECLHYYPCSNYCSQPCSPCQVEILINLPCGHQKLVKCYNKENEQQRLVENEQNCEYCQNYF